MSATEDSAVLAYTVEQVLETMCFSEAVPVSDADCGDAMLATTVAFGGSVSGCLRLEIERHAAHELTASFLGVRELAGDSRLADDTVGELGNVICGRFLSFLYPSGNLRMEAADPEVADWDGIKWHQFRAEAGLLRLAFRFDSTGAQNCR